MQYYDCNYRLYYLRRLRRNVCNQSEVASSAIFYIVVVGAESEPLLTSSERKSERLIND